MQGRMPSLAAAQAASMCMQCRHGQRAPAGALCAGTSAALSADPAGSDQRWCNDVCRPLQPARTPVKLALHGLAGQELSGRGVMV
jgi:hypothetical protein